MEDKIKFLNKVINSYLNELVLYIPDNECYSYPQALLWRVYRNNNIIGWLMKYNSGRHVFNLDNLIPISILELFGVDGYGYNFGEQTNRTMISWIIKDVIIDKIGQYYAEIVDCDVSVYDGSNMRPTKCKYWTKVNLY